MKWASFFKEFSSSENITRKYTHTGRKYSQSTYQTEFVRRIYKAFYNPKNQWKNWEKTIYKDIYKGI